MNGAQLHLAINHLPVIIPVLGAGLLIAGIFGKSRTLRETGLFFILFSAIAALPVYFSGEPAEKVVKNYPGVSRLAIHLHERAALVALCVLEAAGLLSLGGLFLSRQGRSGAKALAILTLLTALVSAGLLLRVAHLGGEIRHEEIQSEDILLAPLR